MNAQAGAKVLAVEKDYVLAKSLSEDMAEEKSLAVEQGDVLRISFEDTIKKLRGMAGMAAPPSRIKVVANLPYNITTDILKRLLPLGEDIASIVFMLQHEVAERLSNAHPSAFRHFALTLDSAS
jgi:16S rRNA A1518/A1519 N6-dimethyltransferase RsmA/KsgA/DIM1 with predicted DNA glycosylase/AP lyase activity